MIVVVIVIVVVVIVTVVIVIVARLFQAFDFDFELSTVLSQSRPALLETSASYHLGVITAPIFFTFRSGSKIRLVKLSSAEIEAIIKTCRHRDSTPLNF